MILVGLLIIYLERPHNLPGSGVIFPSAWPARRFSPSSFNKVNVHYCQLLFTQPLTFIGFEVS